MLGSVRGDATREPRRAGTGGGIAATFNTPIGGILFALEIMLHEVSVRTLVPVAISTVTATYIGQIFFGPKPSFVIPSLEKIYFHVDTPLVLLSYLGLGAILGVLGTIYIKFIYGFEDFFNERIRGSYYLRHMLGMLGVGLLMYFLLMRAGHYYIEGVAYSTIQDVLSGNLSQPNLLLQGASPWFLVQDSNEVIGVVTKEVLAIEVLHSSAGTLTMGQIANQAYVTVEEDMRLFDAMARSVSKGLLQLSSYLGKGTAFPRESKRCYCKRKDSRFPVGSHRPVR